MNTIFLSLKKIPFFIVLLAVLIMLVPPVAVAEEDARPPETMVPPASSSNMTKTPAAETDVRADPPAGTHPRAWYVSLVPGTGNPDAYENLTDLPAIPDLGAGDTVHIWGAEDHAYQGGIAIDAPDVTIRRWEGSPAQPLVTSTTGTASTFTVTADNAAFLDLNISGNRMWSGNGAGIHAAGDAGAPLERLTITDCTFSWNAAGETDACGGALYAGYVDDLLVERTAFTHNFADSFGGGAYVWRCENPTFTATAFTSNSVVIAEGGGAYFDESRNAVFADVTFTDNRAGNAGGARFVNCDAATFTAVSFTSNSARTDCGGAWFTSCDAVALTDATFAGNDAWGSAGGARFDHCEHAVITGTTFTDNGASKWSGGGAWFNDCDAATIAATNFTGNHARNGGGAAFGECDDATITATTFTNNSAFDGGGLELGGCDDVTITETVFTNNAASNSGGGAYFEECAALMLANCRLDNPTNIFATDSTAVLNATRTPGTNIAGGPFLAGNLWLQDPDQKISEWGTDADFDGICDENLTISGFGTDRLPLMHDGGGTVTVSSTPAGASVHLDGVAVNRTTDASLFLPVGDHTITVSLDGYVTPANQTVTVVLGGMTVVDFALQPVQATAPSSHARSSGGGRSGVPAAATTTVPADGNASFAEQRAAIYTVGATAGEAVLEMVVTVEKTVLPAGTGAPAGTVYEYDEVTLNQTTENAIEGVVVLFSVPKAWLEEHGLEPADVVLYRYHDDEWHALPTEVVREDEISWHFSAGSPGFFLLAIGGEPSSPAGDPAMTPTAPAETSAPVTPSPPPSEPEAGTPETAPPFPMRVLAIAGAVALLVVSVVVWKRE